MVAQDDIRLYRYRLSKISTPSWEFCSDDLSYVLSQLYYNVCSSCREEVFPDVFTISEYDKDNMTALTQLSQTDCGAEFDFELVYEKIR